jgi:hypothetical protein
MPTKLDRTGVRYGRLIALAAIGHDENGKLLWKCHCDCGREVVVRGSNLTSHARSCGCLNRELSAERMRRQLTKHGHNRIGNITPEYVAYVNAKQRCTNPNYDRWADWGGRGIEFRFASFEEFFAELGEKPEPKHLYSIDRIDNDGHYEPGNVRWATATQQRLNQRVQTEFMPVLRRAA